jgi:hypothetical protein
MKQELHALKYRWKNQETCFRLQDLCERLDVDYRDARYICERALLPEGVAREPGRGNHRRLTPAQAVWLGMVLKLKACGINTPKAAQITAFASRIQEFSCNGGWDPEFAPLSGVFETQHRWYFDVGDARHVRFVTDSCPSKEGLFEMPWVDMVSRKTVPNAAPIICIRIDISALARCLRTLPKNDQK